MNPVKLVNKFYALILIFLSFYSFYLLISLLNNFSFLNLINVILLCIYTGFRIFQFKLTNFDSFQERLLPLPEQKKAHFSNFIINLIGTCFGFEILFFAIPNGSIFFLLACPIYFLICGNQCYVNLKNIQKVTKQLQEIK